MVGFFSRFDYTAICTTQVKVVVKHIVVGKNTQYITYRVQKREASFKVIYAFIGVLLLVLCVDAAPKSLILLFGPSASAIAA